MYSIPSLPPLFSFPLVALRSPGRKKKGGRETGVRDSEIGASACMPMAMSEGTAEGEGKYSRDNGARPIQSIVVGTLSARTSLVAIDPSRYGRFSHGGGSTTKLLS